MHLKNYSFQKLPFSPFFKTYISDFSKVEEYFEFNPFDDSSITQKATSLSPTKEREAYVSALKKYHDNLGIKQEKALAKLAKSDSLSVVTGQQLGVYGGPLFTVYKTLTTILLARKWEAKLNRPVVPVFWLADEDHDFEEATEIGFSGNDGWDEFDYKQESNGFPVAHQKFNDAILELEKGIKEYLPETDFSKDLWNEMSYFFNKENTFAQAFAKFIDYFFGKYGVLIAGSNHPAIKKILAPSFIESIENASIIEKNLNFQSQKLKDKLHQQVLVSQSNLFYIHEKEGRVKISTSDFENWSASNLKWTKNELIKEINDAPEKFSPNVFLRPVAQDVLLPTLGYVAGPGEIAYYGQMKTLYKAFNLTMPVIFPRLSATIIESGIHRIMEKLPFEISEYGNRIEDLESKFVELNNTIDVEEVFRSWKEGLEETAEEPKRIIQDIDASLEATVGKTVAQFSTDLDKLKGKIYRSIKQQESTQIQRISKIKNQLFPDGVLQERKISPIYFLNKYSLGFIDELVTNMEKEFDLSHHHIIEL